MSHSFRTGRRALLGACLAVTALVIALPGTASAVHDPVGSCSPGYENVTGVDLETYFDGKSNLTICLGGNLTDTVDGNVRWSNMSHVTVRSAPSSWRSIRSRIWIDNTSSNVTLFGLTLDSNLYSGTANVAGLAINANDVKLQRNLITNQYGVAGICITNDADYGVANRTKIIANKIYDCGQDEVHDHGVYTNAMTDPVVTDNWIYENAGRGLQIGPSTNGGQYQRNVIADNCANPLGGTNDCSANEIFWGSSSNNQVTNNTVAFPKVRWNLAGCDAPTPGCPTWTGTGNTVNNSCYYTTVSGYSGNPSGSGISPGVDGKYANVDEATITVVDPQFIDRTTPAHALRNYRIPNTNSCYSYQPSGSIGPPALMAMGLPF